MTEFSIGDVVIIRDYNDMVEEYGADSDGDIFCDGTYFLDEMKYLCGNAFTISDIDGDQVYFEDIDGFDVDEESLDGYAITKLMLRLASDISIDPVSEDELKNVLGW